MLTETEKKVLAHIDALKALGYYVALAVDVDDVKREYPGITSGQAHRIAMDAACAVSGDPFNMVHEAVDVAWELLFDNPE